MPVTYWLAQVLPAAALLATTAAPLDGDFVAGLATWEVAAADPAWVRIVSVKGPAPTALQLDATRSASEVGAVSLPFAIVPCARYRIEARVQRLAGDGLYKVSIEWLDSEGRHIGYDNSWTGVLIGKDWERHVARVVSPRDARCARMLLGVAPGGKCRMTAVRLDRTPTGGVALSIDLYPDALPSDHAVLNLRAENRGEEVLCDVVAHVSMPEGVSTTADLQIRAPELARGDVLDAALPLVIGGAIAPEAAFTCTVTARTEAGPAGFSRSVPAFITTSSEQAVATEDLSAPVAPRSRVKLGCYYFPVMLDWDRAGWGVRRVDYLKPLLGYYDEALPGVADWHIKWAVDHGISYFVFDWYYNQGFSYLNDALERGFLGSRFADRMQFCIDWCNEGQCQEFRPMDFSHASLEGFIRLLCERYFVRANYLRVEGKPVVLIHQPVRIANAHGGWDGCRDALDRMRAIAREYGHPGVYFVAVQNNPCLLDYARGGFDCATAYAYGFCDVPLGTWDATRRELPYAALMPRHDECYAEARDAAHAQGIDYIPSAWIGWDDAGRSGERAVRTAGNTPAAFRRMLESLPQFVDERQGLALFEAWNEWGEGGSAEPGIQYRFGYLDAIRDALTDARGPHVDPVPTSADRARLQTSITFDQVNDHYYERYARSIGLENGLRLAFGSPRDLWLRPATGIADIGVEGGALRGWGVGPDPQFLSPPALGLKAARCSTARLSLSVSGGKEAQLFWMTDESPTFAEERSVRIPLRADGRRYRYVLRLEGLPGWSGRVRQFRLDPTDAPAEFAVHAFECVPTD